MPRIEDVILRGTRAAQPAATTVAPGVLYFVTVENVLERSNGTIWESYSGSVTSSAFVTSMSGFALSMFDDGGGGVESIGIPGPPGAPGPAGSMGRPGMDADEPETLFMMPGPKGDTGAAGGGGSSDLIKSVVKIANAAILTLSSVPVELVAAPGANMSIVPVRMAVFKEGSTAAYSASVTMRLRPAGTAVDLLETSISFCIDTVARDTFHARNMLVISDTSATSYINTALQLSTSADVTGGNAANFLKVGLAYYILDLT